MLNRCCCSVLLLLLGRCQHHMRVCMGGMQVDVSTISHLCTTSRPMPRCEYSPHMCLLPHLSPPPPTHARFARFLACSSFDSLCHSLRCPPPSAAYCHSSICACSRYTLQFLPSVCCALLSGGVMRAAGMLRSACFIQVRLGFGTYAMQLLPTFSLPLLRSGARCLM